MASQQQAKKHEELGQVNLDGQKLTIDVGKQVLQTLGQPHDFLRIQVRLLWGDRYRANVLVGPNAASAKVAHSYFLVVDAEGKVVASTPRITKHY